MFSTLERSCSSTPIIWRGFSRALPVFFIALFLSLFASMATQTSASANQSPPNSTKPVTSNQEQKDTLIVGSEQDYPPFASGMTDDTAGGFTVDLWKAVAAEAGLNYSIRVHPFNQVLQGFKEGTINVLINLAISDARRQFADFSVPHVTVHGAIFVRKGESGIHTEEDLAGKSIIVLKADLAHDYAVSKGWEKQLVLVDTAAEGLRLLASGKHDAMLLAKLAGILTLNETKLTNIKALKTKAGFSQKFAFAVPHGQAELLGKLNEGLALTKSNGTYDALYEKWFGIYEVKEVGLRDILKYIIPLVVLFLGFAGYFLYRRYVERKEAERKYRDLYDNAPDMFLSIEARGAAITDCNQTLLNVTGLSREEVVGSSMYELFHSDCADQARDAFQAFIVSKETLDVELTLRCKNGNKIYVSMNASAVCDERGITLHSRTTLRDITERKLAEEELHRISKLLEMIFENIPNMIFLKEARELRFVRFNQAGEELLGYSRENLMGKNDYDFFPEEQADFFTKKDREVLHLGGILDIPEEALQTLNRGTRTLHTKKVPILDFDGKPEFLLGISEDITERKLRESYREMGREILLILNEPGDIQDSVKRVLTVLKTYTGFDAIGIRLQEGDDFPYVTQEGFSKEFLRTENKLVECDADGKVCRDNDCNVRLECTCGLVISGKTDSTNPLFTDGGSFWTNNSIALLDLPTERDPRYHPRNKCMHDGYTSLALIPIRDNDRIVGLIHLNDRRTGCFTLETIEFVEGIASQIGVALMRKRVEEENLALEQQLQRSRKLESLGVLAGGIAHNFNNLLQVIIGNCALAKMTPETSKKCIPNIELAAESAAELCRQMMDYAKNGEAIQTQVNMRALVDDQINILNSSQRQNLVIRATLPAEITFIKGDASQLKQIVMNLIINACEAIGEEQGLITVSLVELEVKAGKTERDYLGQVIPPGWYVYLEVTDSGCGMDEETKRHIFEPFYTTKFTGRGLGMSATLGIITAHKGALQLTSQQGQGTTVKVYLPVAARDASGDEVCEQTASGPWQGSGTILLVEDEEQVKAVAKEMLEALGFTVLEATNGKEALELYKKAAEEITLVVTDIGMPVMDGYALFRDLKKLDPSLPIIISSGFGDDEVTSRIPRKAIAGLISKPYRFDQLRDVLKVGCGGSTVSPV